MGLRKYNSTSDKLLDEIRNNTESITVSVDAEGLEINTDALETINTGIKTSVETTGTNDLLKFGNSGCVMIAGSAAQTSITAGTYYAVQFIKATTTSAFTMANSTTVAATAFPAGTIVYGDITAITGDTDGLYILYKGNPG